LIFLVEGYEQRAVSDWNVAHKLNYSTRVLQGLSFQIRNPDAARRFGIFKSDFVSRRRPYG